MTYAEQTDLFEMNPRHLSRSFDPTTSFDAAKALGSAGTRRRRLLETFVTGDRTAEEAAARAGYTPADGAWKRVSDLKNLGLIAPTGSTRPGTSGREQDVLRITADGWAALTGKGKA